MTAVTLVVGDEELLVERAVQRVAATALVGAVEGVGPTRHDAIAAELTVDELTEMTSPSLFAEERVIVIRGLQDAGKDLLAGIVAAIEARDEGVTLAITHAGGAKGKAALDAVKGAGAQVVQVAPVKSVRDREQFVLSEVKAAGGTLDRDAAADLVSAVGNDLRELAVAAEQLVADVGRHVSADDVATYHRGRAESTGFAVADRAVEGDLVAALETLRWAFATGVDPILVSSALANNLRTIALVGAAGRGTPDSLAGQLGMPAWRIRRAQGWLRRWRPEAVATAVRAVAVADADLKGAGDDAAYAVERAVLAVATAASGG
jgi:DNA polymerase-3 subunit delta